MSLNIPYRVSNLLFVTSPDVRYVIIGNFKSDPLAKIINKSIPKEITKEVFYMSPPPDTNDRYANNIDNQGHSKVRLVLVNANNFDSVIPAVFSGMGSDITKIKITGDADSGTIDFFDKNNNIWSNKGQSHYIRESVMGAVYSDDIEQYNFNIKNIFRNAKRVSDIYKKRTEGLGNGAICGSEYADSLTKINEILTKK